jgi:hypothetical protein
LLINRGPPSKIADCSCDVFARMPAYSPSAKPSRTDLGNLF